MLTRIITGLVGIAAAIGIITKGGVALKDVNPSSMESKKVKGLYFIGELLDVDALTGGFNLQAAWTMAYVVAKSI